MTDAHDQNTHYLTRSAQRPTLEYTQTNDSRIVELVILLTLLATLFVGVAVINHEPTTEIHVKLGEITIK